MVIGIARDAAPLAEMKLHGLTLGQAHRMLLIDKEEMRLLRLLGFPEGHAFGIYVSSQAVHSCL